MESLVVTLETAKKLKAAGFPQDTGLVWLTYRTGQAKPWPNHSDEAGDGALAAPTAQEIADQLPITQELEGGTGYLQVGPCAPALHAWWAAYETTGPEVIETADTMVEALALLWLKLQEAK